MAFNSRNFHPVNMQTGLPDRPNTYQYITDTDSVDDVNTEGYFNKAYDFCSLKKGDKIEHINKKDGVLAHYTHLVTKAEKQGYEAVVDVTNGVSLDMTNSD